MRKMLQNKKGFTLVELMIVVVIMGILVAVAVPVYNAVTKNAKKKSCDSNLNVMKTQAQSFMMTGASDGSEIVGTIGSTTVLTADTSYLALLDGKALPVCKNGGTYSVEATFTDGGFTIGTYCSVDAAKAKA